MRDFSLPKTPHRSTKSIRFPDDMIEAVEQAIRGRDTTFSAFVVEAVRFALRQLAQRGEGQER